MRKPAAEITQPSPDLVEALAALQIRRGLSDEELASELGISRSMYTHLRLGTRSPGLATLGRIRACYPELAAAVDSFVASKMTTST